MRNLLVSEVFGPTVQGEGPHAGRRCGFVRLGLCNLDCSWCDTPYTWDWTGKNGPPQDRAALEHLDVEALARRVTKMDVGMVVLTGGEPLVQRRTLPAHLAAWDTAVHVETNGTLDPGDELLELVEHWTVSPKLPNSGVPLDQAWNGPVLRLLAEVQAAIKVVCTSPEDVHLVGLLARVHRLPRDQVWIMPEGRSPTAVTTGLEQLTDVAVRYGFNVTGRLHVQAWGDRRGV